MLVQVCKCGQSLWVLVAFGHERKRKAVGMSLRYRLHGEEMNRWEKCGVGGWKLRPSAWLSCRESLD